MAVPMITPFVNIPSIANPNNFDPDADHFLTVQLPNRIAEMNAAGAAIDQAVEDARAAASVAINGSSASSVLLGSGSKSFTVLAGHSWSIGTWLIIASRASPGTHWILGQVTAYSGTSLTVSVHSFGGSGSRNDWDISLTAKPPDIPVATTSANGLMSAADKTKVDGVDTALAGKAATSHTHTTSQVTGLDTALAGKATTSHTHSTSQVTGLDAALASKLPNDGGTFSGGFTSLSSSAFALTGSSITPTAANGHMQRFTAPASAWTFNAPVSTTTDYDMEVLITNPATASGTLTPSGFNFSDISGYAVTANARFKALISVRGAIKTLRIVKDS